MFMLSLSRPNGVFPCCAISIIHMFGSLHNIKHKEGSDEKGPLLKILSLKSEAYFLERPLCFRATVIQSPSIFLFFTETTF